MTTETVVTCDARTGELPGDYGMTPLWCATGVGLTAYTDIHGVTRRFCAHHGAFVRFRYPVAPPDLSELVCDVCHKPRVDESAVRITIGASLGWACWRCQEQADLPESVHMDWHGHDIEIEVAP